MSALKQGLMYVLPDIATDLTLFGATTVVSWFDLLSEQMLTKASFGSGIILFYGCAATTCWINGSRSLP